MGGRGCYRTVLAARRVPALKASDAGIALVKEFEGLATEPYDDVGGKLSWGFGHLCKTGDVVPKHISEADATALLCTDLETAEACVEGIVDVPLSQQQFDGLVALVFNIGCSKFMASTLLRKLNASDYAGAAAEFPRWCKVNGKDVPGLLRRRIAERMLFES